MGSCLDYHPACNVQRIASVDLPTRVLDVSPRKGESIVLVDFRKNRESRGSVRHAKSLLGAIPTYQNYSKYFRRKERIDWHALPRSFEMLSVLFELWLSSTSGSIPFALCKTAQQTGNTSQREWQESTLEAFSTLQPRALRIVEVVVCTDVA